MQRRNQNAVQEGKGEVHSLATPQLRVLLLHHRPRPGLQGVDKMGNAAGSTAQYKMLLGNHTL